MPELGVISEAALQGDPTNVAAFLGEVQDIFLVKMMLQQKARRIALLAGDRNEALRRDVSASTYWELYKLLVGFST